MPKLVIIGSNTIHTRRYVQGILENSNFEISVINNSTMTEFPEIPQYSFDFSLRNWALAEKIRQILSKIQADFVHIHQANSYAWHSLRGINKLHQRPKVILTTWGSDVLLLPKKNLLLAKMVRYNLKHSDVITSDSLYMSSVIQELLGALQRPIYTINYGIQYLPAKPNLAQKTKTILSNRSHSSLYRIDKIIQAFANLLNKKLIADDYRLLIAGGGSATNKLKALVSSLGVAPQVTFVGMVSYSQLVQHYQEAAVFVSVPSSDGSASSLLEAMAYGCIPVLANLPANLEWVLDKVNGFISSNLAALDLDILAAIKLSQEVAKHQKLADFNYEIIANKATFQNNIKSFIDLYH